MQSKRRWIARHALLAWGSGAALCGALNAADPPSPPGSPCTMQRVVHRFDFEEADAAPESLPMNFERFVSPSSGFPPFGAMGLSAECASSGHGSFGFELGGGSMSAWLTRSVIPVLPLADYLITVRVRTEGLVHAKAGLVCSFADAAGGVIAASRSASRLVNTNGAWDTLTVELKGDFVNAADLLLELHVLQPAQLESDASLFGEPRLEDVSGRVWFDEIIVGHLPRITFTMNQTGNLVRQPDVPALQVGVSELTTGPLSARLHIVDIDGETAFDATFPAPRGRQMLDVPIPISRCGWYRAMLDVINETGISRRQWMDFTMIPQRDVRSGGGFDRFGVVIDGASVVPPDKVAALVGLLRCGSADVSIWKHGDSLQGHDWDGRSPNALIEHLLRRSIVLTFAIETVPSDLARALNLQHGQVLELLTLDPGRWRPHLEGLLVNFGLAVHRWRIGASGSVETYGAAQIAPAVKSVTRSFADFVPEPLVFTSWEAHADISAEPTLDAYAVTVPYQIQPEAVIGCLAPWLAAGRPVFATMEPLPVDLVSPRRRVADLMLRTLHAWRTDVAGLSIPAPWRVDSLHADEPMPDATFAPWRTLVEQLAGRTFAGELMLSDGMHAWILSGRGSDDAAIVAWSSNAKHAANPRLQFQLASGPVHVVDAFGNRTIVHPVDDIHTVGLSDLPVFIEDMNLELVQFRSAMTIEPSFVPAVSKIHAHEIVLRNPWNQTISGTIRLHEEDEWQLSPIVQEFAIPPLGETRLPLTIVPQRNILAGRKRVRAELAFNATRAYSLQTEAELEVGLKHIELVASWSRLADHPTGQDDLMITLAVTNNSQAPANLDVYVLATGLGHSRRTIAMLGAGETAMRSFRLADGAKTLLGKHVRIGVAERDGMSRLNRLLAIGCSDEASAQATVAVP